MVNEGRRLNYNDLKDEHELSGEEMDQNDEELIDFEEHSFISENEFEKDKLYIENMLKIDEE